MTHHDPTNQNPSHSYLSTTPRRYQSKYAADLSATLLYDPNKITNMPEISSETPRPDQKLAADLSATTRSDQSTQAFDQSICSTKTQPIKNRPQISLRSIKTRRGHLCDTTTRPRTSTHSQLATKNARRPRCDPLTDRPRRRRQHSKILVDRGLPP